MPTVLTPDATRELMAHLSAANRSFAAAYPGDRIDRQPVHTVYGGAHLFARDTFVRLADAALSALAEYAPDAVTFARAIGLPGSDRLPAVTAERSRLEARVQADLAGVRRADPQAFLAFDVHARVTQKLRRDPVEDFRIDFEDGYGHRPDAEEDGHAVACAEAVAGALADSTLPAYFGIRIKPFTEELRERGVRTLDLFLATLLERSGGRLPANFAVTLPKVTIPEQVQTLVALFERLERHHGLEPGVLACEIMVETTQSVIGPDGRVPLLGLVQAARGRCRGAHLGVYDYTASCSITAQHQGPDHPACRAARAIMQAALAGTGVTLSDGSVPRLPVPPHRPSPGAPLAPAQIDANRAAVHRAWREHFDSVRGALRDGFYQGWDLHPAQLPTRHAAVITFFLEGRDEAAARLRRFVEQSAQATVLGTVFDDAATGQGLLNFFLRGLACGALTEAEALATGLTPDELRLRSFARILERRRAASG